MQDTGFGSKVQYYRKKRGLTQEEFSELIDMSQSNLSAIECGNKLPSFEALIRIIDVLDVTADDLLEDTIKNGHRAKANRLSECLDSLPPHLCEQILAVVETLIGNLSDSR